MPRSSETGSPKIGSSKSRTGRKIALRSAQSARRQSAAEQPPVGVPVPGSFFDRDAQEVARNLLGLVLCHRVRGRWLMASVVEAEAYYLEDKASHASLGYTDKRRALFMPPGTIYMYYARGGDSFNMSVHGQGNAVLFKAGLPLLAEHLPPAPGGRKVTLNWTPRESRAMLAQMIRNTPLASGRARPEYRVCAGQTLLCKALGLKVPQWDAQPLPSPGLTLVDVGYRPTRIVRARRLGIPAHRDPHHLYRFVDLDRAAAATHPPFSRGDREGIDYEWVTAPVEA
jgi:DNA-3-methyladenine glycosylase